MMPKGAQAWQSWPPWRLPARGVPLPVKLFLSYLLVVLVGAVPTYFYLKQVLLAEFMHDAVHRVAGHAQLLANFLHNEENPRSRIVELEHLAPTLTERLTYVGANGRTLFDSSIADLRAVENQLLKPEIARALGTLPADPTLNLKLPHTGISRRYSETGKIDTLYVAVRLVNDAGMGGDCLRLAIPIAEIERLSVVLVRIFRNSQAAAVSSALLLSLLAAVVFMRPLQRLSRTAQALAAGDYTVEVTSHSNDEIGEVGRSLNLLGQQLRKRLAIAEAGEAMLVQLVEGIALPVAIFGSDNRIVAINGAARDAFGKEQSVAETNFLNFVQAPGFAAAKLAAAKQAEPEHLSYVDGESGVRAVGWVHVLTHPAGPPFYAYFGEEVVHRPRVLLPRPTDLGAVAVTTVLQKALSATQALVASRGLTFVMEGPACTALVCDAHDRVGLALLISLTHVCPADDITLVPLGCIEKASRVGIVIGAPLTDSAVQAVGALIHPLGGRLKNTQERCILFLSRA